MNSFELNVSVNGSPEEIDGLKRSMLGQSLNALTQAMFDELIFALNPPKRIVSLHDDRIKQTAALLEWVESPTGPGLGALEELRQQIFSIRNRQARPHKELSAFAISGSLKDLSPKELEAIVELLRQKTGDSSIDIAFFAEG